MDAVTDAIDLAVSLGGPREIRVAADAPWPSVAVDVPDNISLLGGYNASWTTVTGKTRALITGIPGGGLVAALTLSEASGVVSGLDVQVTCMNGDGMCTCFQLAGGTLQSNGCHVVVGGNTAGVGAFLVGTSAANRIVQDNVIVVDQSGTPSSAAVGIGSDGGLSLIRSNYVRVHYDGMFNHALSFAETGMPTNATVYNNVLVATTSAASGTQWAAVKLRLKSSDSVHFLNNTVFFGTHIPGAAPEFTGLWEDSGVNMGSPSLMIANNFFVADEVGAGANRCVELAGNTFAVMLNNDLYGCQGGLLGEATSIATVNNPDAGIRGNISGDPFFADVDGGNFHLQGNTPPFIKEAGAFMPDAGFSVDRDGVQRTAGWSIGAYEQD